MKQTPFVALQCTWLILPLFVNSFSVSPNNGNNNSNNNNANPEYTMFDRFRVDCPADTLSIQQFDTSLVENSQVSSDDEIWAAVYRSNNNKPNVFIRDQFFNAMQSATTDIQSSTDKINTVSDLIETNNIQSSSTKTNDNDNDNSPKVLVEKPVAVARLKSSEDFEDTWVLDSLRCNLRKENTNAACDGGSDFTEALSVGVDALVHHHLKENTPSSPDNAVFEGAIRTKATLYSGRILEDRGFKPVEELSRDMATHVSDYDGCLERYAQRSVDRAISKHPGGQKRALEIISMLGMLDREKEIEAANAQQSNNNGDDSDEEYDPWASMKRML